MGTLNVNEVKAGNETEGFDVSYQVQVNAEGHEHNEAVVYTSRFADKAVIKAVVKTAEEPFLGFAVQVAPEVAGKAGVANLERMEKAARLDVLTEVVNAKFDAATAVEFIKQVQG